MAYYKHATTEKTFAQFVEKNESTLDAEFLLIPNVDYQRDEVYKVEGVGKMFEGTYRFRKISHSITPEGYTVAASGRMVYDAYGNFVEDGYQAGEGTGKKKANTKVKADKNYVVKLGDTLWDIAKAFSGNPFDWVDIEKANREKLVARDKRNASDTGHWIYPGQSLIIPGIML